MNSSNFSIIGNRKRESKIDFDLARRLNEMYSKEESVEKEEKREELRTQEKEKGRDKNQENSNPPQDSIAKPDKPGFIYVPSMNLYVAKERALQGIRWDHAHERLQDKGMRMLTIPEFWNFVNYLKTDYEDRNEAQKILDSIFKVGTMTFQKWVLATFRDGKEIGEWLDACFSFNKTKGVLYINYYHQARGSGVLSPKCSDKLENCIMDVDGYADLNSVNRQGLLVTPSSNQSYIQGVNIYFDHPRHYLSFGNGVASFYILTGDKVVLNCTKLCWFEHPNVGVRAVIEGGSK